ncbi:MAG: molybdopterin synthase sulfur carrier subunit [Proteobacteria bacterium]|nr:MAG: molybdopterin synthase sulfur carrier subunit [Pseudomonadota bacterium]
MKITLKLFAQYRENLFKIKELELEKGTKAVDVMDMYGIANHKLPLGVLMINSRHADEQTELQDGDILSLFPKVGGG